MVKHYDEKVSQETSQQGKENLPSMENESVLTSVSLFNTPEDTRVTLHDSSTSAPLNAVFTPDENPTQLPQDSGEGAIIPVQAIDTQDLVSTTPPLSNESSVRETQDAKTESLSLYTPPTARMFENLTDATGSDNNYSPATNNFELARWVPELPSFSAQGSEFSPPSFDPLLPAPSSTEETRDANPEELRIPTGPINDPPVAVDDVFTLVITKPTIGTTTGSITGNSALNDSDPNNDALTFTNLTDPLSSTSFVFNNDGTFTYTTNTSIAESNLTDVFTYQVTDPGGLTSQATVTINVIVNSQPIANNDTFNEFFNAPGPLTINDTVAPNDVDPNGDPLTFSIVTLPNFATSFTFNANGSFTYVTDSTATPTDRTDTFTYQITDSFGSTSQATATLNLDINYAPVANNDSYNLNIVTPPTSGTVTNSVATNDSDIDGDTLTYSLLSGPLKAGSFSFASNGSFTYTTNTGLVSNGDTDSFTYQVTDGHLTSTATATLSMSVQANLPPDAVDDFFTLNLSPSSQPSNTINGTVTPNDSDPNGDPLTYSLVSGPIHQSSFTFNSNGTFSYSSNTGIAEANLDDSFVYTVTDPGGLSDTATVHIAIHVTA